MHFARTLAAILLTAAVASCNSSDSSPPALIDDGNLGPVCPAGYVLPFDMLAPGDLVIRGSEIDGHGMLVRSLSAVELGTGDSVSLTEAFGCGMQSAGVWADLDRGHLAQAYRTVESAEPPSFDEFDAVDVVMLFDLPDLFFIGADIDEPDGFARKFRTLIATDDPERWVVEGIAECDGGFTSWLSFSPDAAPFWEDTDCELRRGDVLPGALSSVYLGPDGDTLVWTAARRDSEDGPIRTELFHYSLAAGGAPVETAQFPGGVLQSRFGHDGRDLKFTPDARGVLLTMHAITEGDTPTDAGILSFEFVDLDDAAQSVSIDPAPAAGNRAFRSLLTETLAFDASGAAWVEAADDAVRFPGQFSADAASGPLTAAFVADPGTVVQFSDPAEVLVRDFLLAPDRASIAWVATEADRSVCRVSVSAFVPAPAPVLLRDDLSCAVFDQPARRAEFVRGSGAETMVVVPTDADGGYTLFTIDGAAATGVDFTAAGGVGIPALSPDGLFVYFATRDGVRSVIDRLRLSDGSVERVFDDEETRGVAEFGFAD